MLEMSKVVDAVFEEIEFIQVPYHVLVVQKVIIYEYDVYERLAFAIM